MRRAELALAVVACGWLTAAPASLPGPRRADASAAPADQGRDDASLRAQQRAAAAARRAFGRHADPSAAAPTLALPAAWVPPAIPALALAAAISPPPALAGQAIVVPRLARGPPRSR